MLLLVLASIWCWAIVVEKIASVRHERRHSEAFEDAFWSGGSLDDLFDKIGPRPSDPMAAVFASAMAEWRRSISRGLAATEHLRENLQDRVERVMEVTMAREMERVERYMVFLASAGSTAPFIGLFGTVWGIMNSFQAIAAAQDTNLAVVAPGLAEALFTTAMGLIVAVPAVAAFNKFSSDITRYSQRLESFSAEFSAILSRQLEEKA